MASNWPATLPPTSSAPPASTSAPQPTNPPTAATAAEPAAKKEPPSEPIFTLRPGESLEYNANIVKLNSTIAQLKIAAIEKRGSGGKAAWHLQALAHTENPYRMVFELDDQFDSYSDAANMNSVQYEMHLSERGQKVDTIERMLTSMQEPLPASGSGVRVPPGTRDPLGMLEYLRGVDWTKMPEVRSPVFDGHKLYDVRATYRGKAGGIAVPAGTYNTSKIELRVFDNGQETKDSHFVLYLSNDSARLPVLLEAVLPVATARVELTRAR